MNRLKKNKENSLKMPVCAMNLKLNNMMLMMVSIITIIKMAMKTIIMINTTNKFKMRIIKGMIK